MISRRDLLKYSSSAAVGALVTRSQITGLAQVTGSNYALIIELEHLIPKLLAEANVPGASIALVKDNQLIWRKGFGVKDNESKEPVDYNTMFEAASVSKTVFAYAVMKLSEKGLIDLDKPLTKYVSERFLENDPRLDLITARHVLSHTSGFQNWRTDKDPLKIQFKPGEKFSYSGEGYSYLQSVVTRLTGQPIETFMKANIFVPFGMSSSAYVWNDLLAKRMARPHDVKGNPLENNKPGSKEIARYAAAGELRTTPSDYARFLIEVIEPRKADGFRLSKETRDLMIRPQVKVDQTTSWALGWKIVHPPNGDLIVHGGDNKGFHAFVAASVPRRCGLAFMTNGDNGPQVIDKLILGETIQRFFK